MKHILLLLIIGPSFLFAQKQKKKELFNVSVTETTPDTLYQLSYFASVNYRSEDPLQIQQVVRDSLSRDEVQAVFDVLFEVNDSIPSDAEIILHRLKGITENVTQQNKLEKQVRKRAEKVYKDFVKGMEQEQDQDQTPPINILDQIIEVCPDQVCPGNRVIRVNYYNDSREPDCTCVKQE